MEIFDSYQTVGFITAAMLYVIGGLLIAKYEEDLGDKKKLADFTLLFLVVILMVAGTFFAGRF